jgi:hypothetical protein
MNAQAAEFAYGIDGRVFALRVVNQGDAYGRNGCLTHDQAAPMVEFYDTTYAGENPDTFTGDLGQFVSRYYLSTLMDTDPTRNLSLEGSEPVWTVTADSLAQALVSPALHNAVKVA